MKDIVALAIIATVRRWRRNVMTIVAVLIGSSTMVAVIGINQCAAQSVADDLNKLQSTIVVASLPQAAWEDSPAALAARAGSVPNVVASGTLTLPNSPGTLTVEVGRSRSTQQAQAPALVADEAGLRAHGATFIAGGFPSEAVQERDSRQVLLGVTLARQLGVTTENGDNFIAMNGTTVTVVGIVRDNRSSAALDLAVFTSESTAKAFHVLPSNRVLAVRVAPGQAQSVGRQLPMAVHPRNPSGVSVALSPTPEQLKARLLANSRTLVTIIAAVMIVATFFSAATTMQVAVWERRREIGIQRALGEGRSSVGLQFLVESMLLGFVGSLAGWLAGVLIAGAVARISGWLFVLPPIILVVPVVGGAVGAIAGAIPAWKATRFDPAALLREG